VGIFIFLSVFPCRGNQSCYFDTLISHCDTKLANKRLGNGDFRAIPHDLCTVGARQIVLVITMLAKLRNTHTCNNRRTKMGKYVLKLLVTLFFSWWILCVGLYDIEVTSFQLVLQWQNRQWHVQKMEL
jgi:hypothetical protein